MRHYRAGPLVRPITVISRALLTGSPSYLRSDERAGPSWAIRVIDLSRDAGIPTRLMISASMGK
jgi:hypothetical protein